MIFGISKISPKISLNIIRENDDDNKISVGFGNCSGSYES